MMDRPVVGSIGLHEAKPGIIQLEDDNKAPLLGSGAMLAIALNAKGRLEAENENLKILAGHFATCVCALITMLEENPHTKDLVMDGMVIIPNELSKRVTGMQIEAIETADGDVGICRRERAPEPLVVGGRSG
jgi:hypothetical protein